MCDPLPNGSERIEAAGLEALHEAATSCVLMTCTGEAVPGDPQHSYHHIEWAGFEPTVLRGNWSPK